jgi:hypothetical protein
MFSCRRQSNRSTTVACPRDLLLSPHRRSPPLPGLVVSSLGLAKTLREDLRVVVLPIISIQNVCRESVDIRQHPWRLPRGGA